MKLGPSITQKAKRAAARVTKIKAPVSSDPSNTQQVDSVAVRRSRIKAPVSSDPSITQQVKKAAVKPSQIRTPLSPNPSSITQKVKKAAARPSEIRASVSPDPSITQLVTMAAVRPSKIKAPVLQPDPSSTQQVKRAAVSSSKVKAPVSLPDPSSTQQVKRAAVSSSKVKAPVSLPDPSSTQQVKRAVNQSSMLNKLYFYCTRRPKAHEELSVLVNMFGVYLSRKDSYTLRPKGWLNDMVILAAGKIMMEEEKAKSGAITRHIFSPHFMHKVINNSNLSNEDSYKPWRIEDVSLFVLKSKLGYDVTRCKLIFAPALFEEHWSCYVLEPKSRTLFVLDSMGGKLSTGKKNLDIATKLRFEELLVLIKPSLTKESAKITLVHADVPVQPNNHDCGIYVLKYLESWDGSIKWQGKTMPDYSYKEILEFRQSFMCRWVQHPENKVRDEILKAAGVRGK
ncbi:hypothetical protein RIF29_23647 [Crotalaria pallida]|uniref:Ubiquitin-like protease family profile domain-containing protein n=1 Tax=Crotalaria pallida TaxID=3830 RepID=A0AAN9IB34_CROPI